MFPIHQPVVLAYTQENTTIFWVTFEMLLLISDPFLPSVYRHLKNYVVIIVPQEQFWILFFNNSSFLWWSIFFDVTFIVHYQTVV